MKPRGRKDNKVKTFFDSQTQEDLGAVLTYFHGSKSMEMTKMLVDRGATHCILCTNWVHRLSLEVSPLQDWKGELVDGSITKAVG